MSAYTIRAPLKIIYFALISSTFIYALIIWLVTSEHAPKGTLQEELHNPIVLVLMILCLVSLTASVILGMSMPDDPLRRHVRYITRWSIVESVAIYGLIASFLTFDWHFYAIGWTLALVGYALAFPTAPEAYTNAP